MKTPKSSLLRLSLIALAAITALSFAAPVDARDRHRHRSSHRHSSHHSHGHSHGHICGTKFCGHHCHHHTHVWSHCGKRYICRGHD